VKEKGDGFTKSALRYTAIATMLPVSTFAGYLIGHWLDERMNSHYFMIIFVILGVAGGFVQLIRELTRDTGSK
jgi:F0F1-type ATP synthase assembly protein I